MLVVTAPQTGHTAGPGGSKVWLGCVKSRCLTLEGLRTAKKEATSDRLLGKNMQHHETWSAKNRDQMMELMRGGTVMWRLTYYSGTGVAGRELARRHQRHPGHAHENPFVCIDYGYL